MPNKYVNKVVIGKETKLDLTADTVTPDKLAKGITAHDKSGAPITGTSTKDADTSDATAAVAEVLNGKTFYARGAKMTGTMPNNGEVNGEISTVSGKYTIPMGFHDGAGGVTIAATEQAKLVPANIREGVTVLGVKGSMSGSEGMKPQAKSVTPSFEQQVVLPDSEYNCLSQVTVAAIPATYVDDWRLSMAVNKVVINDEVVLDLTGDTVQAADLPKGVIAHSATGAKVTGTTNYAGSSNAGGSATSAEKLNNSLTIKLNGTSQGAWDGSSAKTIDITAASVGATSVTLRRW